MDLSDDERRGEGAVDVLVERVENDAIALKEEEATVSLQGQHEDWWSDVETAMTSYITRRQRLRSRVRPFDERTTVSDNFLADYLLDCSNISKNEKILIQTV